MIENSVACQKLTTTIIAMGSTRKRIRTSVRGEASSQPVRCRFVSPARMGPPVVVSCGCTASWAAPRAHPGRGGLGQDQGVKVKPEGSGREDQAAMNSFHLRTMYWFSSMTAFQQATEPMRSSKEPPSRTSPACAMASPKGLVMVSVASLPSNQ